MNKKALSERDICTKSIIPRLLETLVADLANS
jgi:hypothetical protein